MLVPRVSLVLVGLKHVGGEVSTTLAIPLRPSSARVVLGDLAGIEARHIGFETRCFRPARSSSTCDPLSRLHTSPHPSLRSGK